MSELRFLIRVYKNSGLYKINRFYSTCNNIRVRFAPSPTGFLHLGGLRTALYNYLFAKAQGGTFILRIEDTDQTRLVPGAVEKLQSDLEWAGIIPDEGPNGGPFGPYLQSKRLNIYKKEVQRLVDEGTAYHCFCSERRLDLLRKEALRLREVPRYDNKCRHLSRDEVNGKLKNNEVSCIRFKLSSDNPTYDDMVFGTITHDVAALEGDPVILKTDGFPTYHLANVVDDHNMQISHVLRGVEWQLSTTKHILIYRAFGWKPPSFGHLPLLVNPDGTKFSKRQGAMTVESFRNDGIYPRALVNFITYTGGFVKAEGTPHEPWTFTVDELAKRFDFHYANKSPCRLMFEQLPEFNRAELARQISDKDSLMVLVAKVKQLVIDAVTTEQRDINVEDLHLDDDHIISILKWCVPRCTKLTELVGPNLMFLWTQPSISQISDPEILSYSGILRNLIPSLNSIHQFDQNSIKDVLKEFAVQHDIKFNQLMKVLRICLSGLKSGPGVAESMEILGKESTCKRLNRICELQSPNQSKSHKASC